MKFKVGAYLHKFKNGTSLDKQKLVNKVGEFRSSLSCIVMMLVNFKVRVEYGPRYAGRGSKNMHQPQTEKKASRSREGAQCFKPNCRLQ